MSCMDYKAVAIIPARGGSKAIHRKNVRLLGEKPLIAWSIEAALSVDAIDSVFVSTDDEEIAEIARHWGAEVPFLRPPNLATDTAQIGDVINHALDYLDREYGRVFGAYLTLYPTHPFRTHDMLHTAASVLKSGACQKFTTYRPIQKTDEDYGIIENGRLRMIPKDLRESKLPHYRNYGLVQGIRIRSDNSKSYLYPVTNPIHLIDIDTEPDLALANEVLNRGLYDFNATA